MTAYMTKRAMWRGVLWTIGMFGAVITAAVLFIDKMNKARLRRRWY